MPEDNLPRNERLWGWDDESVFYSADGYQNEYDVTADPELMKKIFVVIREHLKAKETGREE